ncbi:DNA topoisomerase 3 [Fodinisporobacter ferrooxydans]|uniref:DNA topoisomerase n=1 Tax=Fodinisporobacter ferrooxydans TaxID=2901836 RepID=A0ABY4CJN9_9BACL|nr:DNA topoisomerase 3 [Alicyclobacillaceae bacterium MYW30-H2]
MFVILAEKPSVATGIAAMLGEIELPNGEILKTDHMTNPKYDRLIKGARKDGYFKGKKHIVTYAFGHLLTLREPDEVNPSLKSWKMETLPFHIENIPLKITGGATYANNKKQLDTLKKLCNDPKTEKIIVATDAGREGEHIFRTIYNYIRCKKPFERMWIKDQTEDGLRKAYLDRKSGKAYDNLASAAKSRAEADYLVGMNITRAMTIRFGGYKNVLSIGRVQTPTLAILVQRELEILNFKPENYWTLTVTFEAKKGTYESAWFKERNGEKQERFKTEHEGNVILQKVQGKPGTITSLSTKEEKEGNPKLFDLTELQRTAGKIFGYSASNTLKYAQALYDEHKLITYPRTASRYIASGTGKTVTTRLQALQSIYPFAQKALQNNWVMAKTFIDDSKTTDHEAILPTAKTPHLEKLSPEEKHVYELIVKRFVAAFFPPCIWEITNVVTIVEGETFAANGKTVKQIGWREVEGTPNAKILPLVSRQETVNGKDAKLMAKQTQPPKRYDSTELVKAMANAGKFVEDQDAKDILKEVEGIGTVATRAGIIDELKKRGYVKEEKKLLRPTPEKGMALFEVLPVEILKSPQMTAEWEMKLGEIEQGKRSYQQFMKEMQAVIQTMVSQVQTSAGVKLNSGERKQTAAKPGLSTKKIKPGVSGGRKELGICPACKKGKILEYEKAYGCSEYQSGCKFAIWKNAIEKFGKKKITLTEAKQLIAKGQTAKKVKLHSNAKNKDFEAYIALEKERLTLKFS